MKNLRRTQRVIIRKSRNVAVFLLTLAVATSSFVPLAEAGAVIKPQNIVATGGTITTITQGNTVYRLHTFTATTTTSFTVTSGFGKVWYLVVAGGGGGGSGNAGIARGGGGGAGGFRTNGGYNFVVTPRSYTVTVGDGGATDTNGSDSVFGAITATGGGKGGNGGAGGAGNGGSGGGGGNTTTAGTGTAGQGNDGGTGTNSGSGGGGGGASAVGSNVSGNNAGSGGAGTASSISGSSVTYAGGGGGAGISAAGSGGAGGGGGGGTTGAGTAGTTSTGGGGGGGQHTGSSPGGSGGSGVVIIRYPIGTVKTGVTAGDPYWGNVALLAVNDNAANASTSFTDQSKSARALTANGNAQYSTTQAPTGLTSSLALDGTGDYLSGTSPALGSGDFTIDWFDRPTAISGSDSGIIELRNADLSATGFVIEYQSSTSKLRVFSSGNLFTATNARSLGGTWQHHAIVRSGTTVTYYVDGVANGSFTNSTNWTDTNLRIGSGIWGSSELTGNIAGVRITPGVARYTSTFTPPTLPFPAALRAIPEAVKPAAAQNSPIVATGGTITTVTTNGVTRKVHTFTSSGTFQVTSGAGKVWYLVVAGGGGGGGNVGGGGGAGGFRTNGAYTYPVARKSYTVTVGAGGNGGGTNATGSNGNDSVFDTITSTGGGGGGPWSNSAGAANGAAGGSGGGGGSSNAGTYGTGGAASPAGQGNAGGTTTGGGGGNNGASGGGGAGAAASGATGGNGTAGGIGRVSTISGSSVYYAGGGGGGGQASVGAGGTGGGGAGGPDFGAGTAGTANTGGGGGGGGPDSGTGAAGGSGVVIISYVTTKQVTSKNAPISGLIGWWPFDSSAVSDKIYDRSGQGRNGYFSGTSATSSAQVTGKIGQALAFNGSDDVVKTTISSGLSDSFTISAWVKPRALMDVNKVMVSSEVAGYSNYWFALSGNSSGFRANLYDGTNTTTADSTTVFSVNQWYHVTLVRDVIADKLKIYVNGNLENQSTDNTGSVPSYSDFTIGKQITQNRPFNGLVDDVRVYNRALSAAEILQLYNSR